MGEKGMNIREIMSTDVPSLVRLFTESVHGLALGAYSSEQCAAWAPAEPDMQWWHRRFASVSGLVASFDSALAGFVTYESSGHIDLLYTHPAFARRGVASALIAKAEAKLHQSGVKALFTEASLVARPVFEAFGFRTVEEQVVPLRGGTFRRFAMRKDLP